MAVKQTPRDENPDPSRVETASTGKSKRSIGWILFWYGVPVLVSFMIIFGTVYYTMINFPPEDPEMLSGESAEEGFVAAVADSVSQPLGADSSAVALADTAIVKTAKNDTLNVDSDHAMMLEQERLYHQIFTLKDRVLQQQNQIIEMSLAMNAKDRVIEELEQIKEKYEAQLKDLEFLKTDLPDSIIRKVIDELNPRPLIAAQTAGEGAEAGPDTAGDNQKKLAKIYDAMKPEDAAPILEKLGDDEIIEILLSIKQRQAAKILTQIDQSLAARISKKINNS